MNTSKTVVKTLILLCLGMAIIGCAAQEKQTQPLEMIKVGMDEGDVRDILGPPGLWLSHENGKEEIWQYCQTERFQPVNDVVVVWFLERIVTGVDTYRNVGFGNCTMFFRKLKWEDAPHRKKP